MNNLIIGQMVIGVNSVDSTNNYTSNLSRQSVIKEGTVVNAEIQHSGKGQREKSWKSEPGKNLTFSIYLTPDFLPATDFFYLNKMVASAITKYLNSINIEAKIKWPNDIYAGSGKIGGILIENSISAGKISRSIVGIGININQEKFSTDLPNPVSLKTLTGKEYDKEKCLKELLSFFDAAYLKFRKDRKFFDSYYSKYLYGSDKMQKYSTDEKVFTAKVKGITQEGRLVLQEESGDERDFGFHDVKLLT